MARKRNPLSGCVLVDHVTAALSRELLEHRDNLASGQAWQFRHQTATSTIDQSSTLPVRRVDSSHGTI